jgi:hypothetical protein
MSAFSDNGRGLATGSNDAQRASVPSASSTETTFTHTSNGNGGVDRVSVRSGDGAPDKQVDHNRQPGFSARNTDSASRVTIGGNGSEKDSSGFARASAGATVNDREGVMSIRSQLGTPRSGPDIKPNDLITVMGYETTVAAALAMGVITRDGHGTYYNVNRDQLAAEDEARAQHRAEQLPQEQAVAPLADPETEALVTQYATRVGQGDAQAVIKDMVEGREVNADTLGKAASAMGIEPSQVSEHLEVMRQGFERQAQDAVSERVLSWARQSALPELKDAVRAQLNQGSLAGYHALSAKYLADLPRIDPSAILNSPDAAKLDIRRDKSGEITLFIPQINSRTTWNAALRMGYIGPKFTKK